MGIVNLALLVILICAGKLTSSNSFDDGQFIMTGQHLIRFTYFNFSRLDNCYGLPFADLSNQNIQTLEQSMMSHYGITADTCSLYVMGTKKHISLSRHDIKFALITAKLVRCASKQYQINNLNLMRGTQLPRNSIQYLRMLVDIYILLG